MSIDFEELTGRSVHRLSKYSENIWIHENIIDDFVELKNNCETQEIVLEIASGFRSYERQKLIWEEKITGERPLYDQDENLVDPRTASEDQILQALLAWSAIPGCSRHHWGTDLDLFDLTEFTGDLKLQLKIDEYLEEDGPCFRMNRYLESLQDLKFFRPYKENGNGIQSEPWHYSHTLTANRFSEAYDISIFKKNLETADFSFSEKILHDIDSYFNRFKP